MRHTLDSAYILDADVLIDYRDADISVVSGFASQVTACYIGRSAFGEVRQLTESQAKKIHLEILTPDLEMIAESARLKGRLSAYDWETYFLAKEHGLKCVSNDTSLRKQCISSGVAVMWGLEAMKLLVGVKVISVRKAISVARKIGETNHHITEEIVSRFEHQVTQIATSLRGSG